MGWWWPRIIDELCNRWLELVGLGGGCGREECLKVTRMKIIEVVCRELKCIKSEIGRGCLIGRWM